MGYMTRRTFVELGAIAGGLCCLVGARRVRQHFAGVACQFGGQFICGKCGKCGKRFVLFCFVLVRLFGPCLL